MLGGRDTQRLLDGKKIELYALIGALQFSLAPEH